MKQILNSKTEQKIKILIQQYSKVVEDIIMILSEMDRQDFIFSMKTSLLEHCKKDPSYFGNSLIEIVKFIKEDITYEQLLNLTFNEKRDTNYLPAELLEFVSVKHIVNELSRMYPLIPIAEAEAAPKKMDRLKVLLSTYKKQISDYLAKNPALKKYGSWAGSGVAATVGALFVYKKFFSQQSNNCKGKIGNEYKKCIVKIKNAANQEAIRALKVALASCNNEPNVKKCKEKYLKEINKRKNNSLVTRTPY